MNETALQDLHDNFSKENGWLTKLIDAAMVTGEEIHYLEWLDDGKAHGDKNVKLLENEVEREGGVDIYFLETDQEKIDLVCKKISAIELAYEDAIKKDLPTLEKQLILWTNGYDKLRKLRNKIRARMVHTKYPESMSVTELDIVTAREFPLDELVEVNRQKMMLCPFHADKSPSFYVKGGWGYCFSCGKSCDAIGYQMEVRGMKFVDAIKSLIN